MLTAKTSLRSMLSLPAVPLMTHTSTSGGSSDTDENAFAVIPYCSPGPCVVITVTPVAKAPSARRKSAPLNASACGLVLRRRHRA